MAIELPKKPKPEPEPTLAGANMIIIGAPKVGKSTLLTQWPNCLTLDTEHGHRFYGGHLVLDLLDKSDDSLASPLEVLGDVYRTLSQDCPYDAVAIDTLGDVASWMEAEVCKQYGVKTLGDNVPGGTNLWVEHRKRVEALFEKFCLLPCTTIFVAHSKQLIAQDLTDSTKVLDLYGALSKSLPGKADIIGVAQKNKAGEYRISFKGYEEPGEKGFVVRQQGSRLKTLEGKEIENNYEALMSAVKGE